MACSKVNFTLFLPYYTSLFSDLLQWAGGWSGVEAVVVCSMASLLLTASIEVQKAFVNGST
jgi:hypothetical protein